MNRFFIINLLILTIYGCNSQVQTPAEHPDTPAEFRGTVGSYCELTGYYPVRVQSFSLVVGLTGTGSSECPTLPKEYLLKHLRILRDQGYLPSSLVQLTPEQIITSHDTAVVEVIGLVPSGAPKRERFDVEVVTLEGTQTTSLQGGWLIPTELRQVTGRQLAGRIRGRATGPVFINPLPLATDTGQMANPRRGTVLGGGQSIVDRTIQLSLLRPDFRIAQQIQNRLNSRFEEPDGPRVAQATRERVSLRIPPSYRQRYNHFISLVWALYLQDSPGFQENKLRELDVLARKGDLDQQTCDKISLAWEAIGRPALAYLEILSQETELGVISFYAARTAFNLGQPWATDALNTIALDENHPLRLSAAKVLNERTSDMPVRATLGQLINDRNNQIRLSAYEGLRNTRSILIQSFALSRDCKLDVVESTAENAIYIWAALDPRIVIFGKEIRCRENVFFESADNIITINADAGDDRITITRKLPDGNGYMSLRCSFGVVDLIQTMARPWKSILDEKPRAPGLNFSEIVGILYQLCEKEVIPARFLLHRVSEDRNG